MARKGNIPWNKGKTKNTDSRVKKQSETQTGRSFTDQHKENLSKAMKGRRSPMKGVSKSDAQKKKQSTSMKIHYKTNSVHNKGKTKKDYPPLDKMSKSLSKTKKKQVVEGTYKSPMQGKKHTDAAKKKNADKHRHPADPKTKALLVKQRNTTKGKENAKKGWHAMRKNIGRPNIPEKEIGEILSGIGIKCKFLQNVHYTTIDNKSDSKEMDVVWKDSMGNKKIIEYNGRYHFDSREHKPDEYVIVHNESRKCQDIWDEENMILNQIRKEGYEILVVWQLDWKKERDLTIKKILKFANSKSLS